jgi:hypothetical protein
MLSSARCSKLIALPFSLWLAACSDSATEPQPATSPANTKATPKVTDPGANMVAAVSAGRTSRAVGVHFSLGNAPTVDTALPVDIAIIPHETFATLSARFEGQDGLTVMSGDVLAPEKNAGAEKAIKHQLTLMPSRAGVFIITASVETEGAEGTVTRVFSIPVIVETNAPPAAEPAAQAPEMGSGPNS